MNQIKMADMTQEQKDQQIERIKVVFNNIRSMMAELEGDLTSENLMHQASAVWISSQFCSWYMDFRTELERIDQSQKALNNLQNEIKEASNDTNNVH